MVIYNDGAVVKISYDTLSFDKLLHEFIPQRDQLGLTMIVLENFLFDMQILLPAVCSYMYRKSSIAF